VPEDAPQPGIDPKALAVLLEGGEAQLVDVRQPEEWEAGHIPGARHIAIGDLAGHAEEINRESPVIVYCRTGNRSPMAVEALRLAGFDARVLDGGITGWAERGLPLEPESGTVAARPADASVIDG
jgi:rhodanese-related sulfurtransferase